jgi:hypothetical protein
MSVRRSPSLRVRRLPIDGFPECCPVLTSRSASPPVIGSISVMVARKTAPNRIGPGSVFPDASYWTFSDGIKGSPMASGPFWAGLICQLVIVVGYFWFCQCPPALSFGSTVTGLAADSVQPLFCCTDRRETLSRP